VQVPSPAVDLVVRHPAAGRVVIHVSGVPGRADVAVLQRTLAAELDRGPALVVVAVDRSGITPDVRAVLGAARDRARRAGGGLRVVGTDPDRPLEITDLLGDVSA
jgi:hypothetical protein